MPTPMRQPRLFSPIRDIAKNVDLQRVQDALEVAAREFATYVDYVFKRPVWGSVTWDPENVGAGATVDTVLTTSNSTDLTGLRAGMAVVVTPPPTLNAGLYVVAWVPSNDRLTIRLTNLTGAGINPASGAWSFMGWSVAKP